MKTDYLKYVTRSPWISAVGVMILLSGIGFPVGVPSAFGETQAIGKGLLVAPVRLDFEGRTRSGTFKILNRDAYPVSYRVSFTSLIDRDQGEDARNWVRFSPRKVTLAPGEHQTVRVVVRKPENLPAGEYTARILIQAIPPARPQSQEPTDQIQVNLDIVYGISIPVHIIHKP